MSHSTRFLLLVLFFAPVGVTHAQYGDWIGCCRPDGMCFDTWEGHCWWVHGFEPVPHRQCDEAPGRCVDLGERQGACCQLDGTCFITWRDTCEIGSAVFLGDGTTCQAAACQPMPEAIAACSLGDGFCWDTTLEDCAATAAMFPQLFEFHAEGWACHHPYVPKHAWAGPLGSCCIRTPDEMRCVEEYSLPCLLIGAADDVFTTWFEGRDTCGPCGQLCYADIDEDGVVAFGDLLTVISWWHPTCCQPFSHGDVDGDHRTDITDLLLVLSMWGECG